MATRSEREKAQKLNEQHQAILSKMLREEDNKYCADCEAKGPRWASWNLGVFICIRCAGIHRNLGVHISRVKSVNLDQWTPEQIQSVQDMGNSKARRLYEATLPESFRRPQTDQAVEFFIRDKYERKKYYDKSVAETIAKSSDATIPSVAPTSSQAAEKSKAEERGKEERRMEREVVRGDRLAASEKAQKKDEGQREARGSPARRPEPAVDLLGLDAPVVSAGSGSAGVAPLSDDLDIFGPMVSNPLPSSANTQAAAARQLRGATSAPGAGGSGPAQGDLDLFGERGSKAEDTSKKPLSKDSILSLYSSGGGGMSQQPAPAAMYMGASQMQFPPQPAATFQGYATMGGAVPASSMMGAMVGQNTGMMVSMAMPNGFMGSVPGGGDETAPGMMPPQGGAAPTGAVPAQNMYAMQPGQQGQWNMGQVNQQMSGMSLNGVGGGAVSFGQPPAWTAPPPGQTLSTQLWK
ncbi:LOW QUALITY PROTEIN: stromal membrane-associated protein 1-like [Brienomyrus brachyistius]|uniref:LOW QUALITY PROTEIN: stromal membrane-associated protein 1-like n=1 Tax=Brienomyrus brachyistius TaxID=42636 RepID=UPI0020B1DDD5|nr:LOW QUALITY PROTEIN: stromal membrane-associated protein 1-like [Brienomyrus brachyistius]